MGESKLYPDQNEPGKRDEEIKKNERGAYVFECGATEEDQTKGNISRKNKEEKSLMTDKSEYIFPFVTSRVEGVRSGLNTVLSLSDEEAASNTKYRSTNNAINNPNPDAKGTLFNIDMLDITHTSPLERRRRLQITFQKICDEMQRELQQCKEEKANVERLLGEALFERDQAMKRLQRQQEMENIRRRQATTAEVAVVSSAVEKQRSRDVRGSRSETDPRGDLACLSAVEGIREIVKRPTTDHDCRLDSKARERQEERKPSARCSDRDNFDHSSDNLSEDEQYRKTRRTLRKTTNINSLIDKSIVNSSNNSKDDFNINLATQFDLIQHTDKRPLESHEPSVLSKQASNFGLSALKPCKTEICAHSETYHILNKENCSENVVTGTTRMQQSDDCLDSRAKLTAFGDCVEKQSIEEEPNRETDKQSVQKRINKEETTAINSPTARNVPPRTWNSVETAVHPLNKGAMDTLKPRCVYLEQGARPKQFPSTTISREREDTFISGSPRNDGLYAGFLARHTRDASIHQYAYHMNGNAAMPTLPHEYRASTADVDSESNVDLDDSFAVASHSQNQLMVGPNSETNRNIFDYPSHQIHLGYNVDPRFSNFVPIPPFMEGLPNSLLQSGWTSQTLAPSSTAAKSSSSDRNGENKGFSGHFVDGTQATASSQTMVYIEQNCEKQSKNNGILTKSVYYEETKTVREEPPVTEAPELANLSISSTGSTRSEEERASTLEARVAKACAMVEKVFRERRAREQEIQEREQRHREERERALIERERRQREEQERIARDQEQKEISLGAQDERQRDGKGGLEQTAASTASEVIRVDDEKYPVQESPQWLCEHYQRRCKLKFPCCNVYHPCHRCHNSSDRCANESAKAHEATHLQCIVCRAEQPVTESYDTQTCQSCGTKLSEYFCPKCKHFTGVEKKPYHCDKCGICRIHKDKSFHCEVCNVCLDKRLEGKHKCRPNSGHDECCICLEDAFSGCQILPCSHKVHRDCAIAMVRNGIRTCPVCRHPLYSAEDE